MRWTLNTCISEFSEGWRRKERGKKWISSQCVKVFLEFTVLPNNCPPSVSCVRLRFMVRGCFPLSSHTPVLYHDYTLSDYQRKVFCCYCWVLNATIYGWEIVGIWIFKSPLIAVIKCKRICSTVLVFDCSVFHSDHFGRRSAFSWLLQKSCSPSQAPCFFNMSSLPASIACLPCPQQRTGSTGAAGKRCARLSAPSYLWYFKISASFYSCPRHTDIVAQWVVFLWQEVLNQ